MSSTSFLRRFSSRQQRLSHVFLKDRLAKARTYKRIAGYFRSSIFELVTEEITHIEQVQIVCNSDLDPWDIAIGRASRQAREMALKEKWNEEKGELITSLLQRPRYRQLYEILKSGKVEVRVVSAADAPFLHGKAGVIEARDGTKSAFIGSLNETRQGWQEHYEIVWEDQSPEGVAWVEAEFQYLWERSVPLPEAIVEEVGRLSRKVEVFLQDLQPADVPGAAWVEAPLYRRGEVLKPWQQSFVEMFLEHRELYGAVRLILADEVGLGKTLSLAVAAMVACLLEDGPALILCPATLCQQWQVELKDKLGIPSAVWLSNRKVWQDANGHIIKTKGAEDIGRCPYQIGIVSTGLIFHNAPEAQFLLERRFGTIVLDEAHRARCTRGVTVKEPQPNNLLKFMGKAAIQSKHVLLGTATPIQTHVEELWDLLEVLNSGAEHVLGRRPQQLWQQTQRILPILTGQQAVTDEHFAWNLLRNPLPPSVENPLFDHIRSDLNLLKGQHFTDKPLTELEDFTRQELRDALEERQQGLTFFQRHNPILRHTVLRKRSTLEELGLLERIAVDIWPSEAEQLPMFCGLGLLTSPEFDIAYEAAQDFARALRQRTQSAGFMKSIMQSRICSSIASGLSTAQKLLEKRRFFEEDGEEDWLLDDLPEILEAECAHLERIVSVLNPQSTDPKLDAVLYFLQERRWLDLGCIIFSQYFDTAHWVADNLSQRLPQESVALYAGAQKSGLFFAGEWRSTEREDIKRAVRERTIRLVVATDAACEGLNLQSLGTLINIDLPWNPSRLEQRIGRIKRFGQTRDRVDMLNLVYHGTHDEKVYEVLSRRMKDRYDLFGSLPDTIEDDWIENIETLEAKLQEFTERKKQANAFELRYAGTVEPKGPRWETCEKVLSRRDIVERLSEGW
ncbi:MAG TPA: DEAD/DEAH box helicase [Synechococcus sp. M44_DOE_062]|mgnify:CR=1 FL=1|nr:DEAD/DEAH box helicase [Synechococcus sp. M44_DOE_062]